MPDVRAGFSANDEPVNVAALAWLVEMGIAPEDRRPHLMTLLLEGFMREVPAPGLTASDQEDLAFGVWRLSRKSPELQLKFLLTHPDMEVEEHTDLMLNLLAEAATPLEAMGRLIETVWDRVRAEPDEER